MSLSKNNSELDLECGLRRRVESDSVIWRGVGVLYGLLRASEERRLDLVGRMARAVFSRALRIPRNRAGIMA